MAADSGMDTCPSPENADSRKRPLDGDTENGDIKRSHFSSGNKMSTISSSMRSFRIFRAIFPVGMLLLSRRDCAGRNIDVERLRGGATGSSSNFSGTTMMKHG
ncbi:hypothetical protein WA026_018673 [Henosepilachna vigintioctopunctata]|uniref:Uncharacterized protein n=1 Tax=Henosepilachna vigintioctopunctata TaxID=420089 RepID=A0AAW1UAD2_9CUCU